MMPQRLGEKLRWSKFTMACKSNHSPLIYINIRIEPNTWRCLEIMRSGYTCSWSWRMDALADFIECQEGKQKIMHFLSR
jgi:hypothetical protein